MGGWTLEFVDERVEMDAPVEEVFGFFQQVERWPSWASGIRRAFRKSDGPWGKGFSLGFVPDFLPVPLAVRVLRYEEGRLIEWGVETRLATVLHRFEFEVRGRNRCALHQREEARGLAALLMRPLARKIGAFDRGLARDLQTAVRKGLHRA
jgi:hypothetical protein